jgi:hypothetical protein
LDIKLVQDIYKQLQSLKFFFWSNHKCTVSLNFFKNALTKRLQSLFQLLYPVLRLWIYLESQRSLNFFGVDFKLSARFYRFWFLFSLAGFLCFLRSAEL